MISIRDLRVKLNTFSLDSIRLEVIRGEYLVVLGPTGAGKTVLLEAIAGLHNITSGEIWLDDKNITLFQPEKRGIGIVYQDQALFPHLSVKENIAFGLRVKKLSKEIIDDKISKVSATLSIGGLLNRKPQTLSGGEQQRVALARALVMEPSVLLLDEPLSALDPELREKLQQELKKLHRQFGITIIHVTHDFEEAIMLGQRIVILNQGRIMQVGSPEEIMYEPASEFIARFTMSRNIFKGVVDQTGEDISKVLVNGTEIQVKGKLEGDVQLVLRPEDIVISAKPAYSVSINSFEGVVSRIVPRGAYTLVTISVPPDFTCLITRHAINDLSLTEGSKVFISFKASSIYELRANIS
ncbi:MAG: ABC transporter ATP-binding protein [Chloroflexi bacterium]|nr:ABC transporter ATP-binding protein [Chloroflexota bacterium]